MVEFFQSFSSKKCHQDEYCEKTVRRKSVLQSHEQLYLMVCGEKSIILSLSILTMYCYFPPNWRRVLDHFIPLQI